MKIQKYHTGVHAVKLDRPIGDSQVSYESITVETLHLTTDTGLTGFGFQEQRLGSEPSQPGSFEKEWAVLEGNHPAAPLNRILRPRGGNWHSVGLSPMTDIALWD